MSGRVPTACAEARRPGGAPAAAGRVRGGADRDRGRGRRLGRGHAERPPARARRARRAAARDRRVDRSGAARRSSGSQPVFDAISAASERRRGRLPRRRHRARHPARRAELRRRHCRGGGCDLACSADREELGGRTREHEKFGTAVVVYGDGQRVDVVTARTEFYDAPAALPAVEHASIREDLYRRDFTVNAMAASLKAEDFGRLVDPFGGRADLAAETVASFTTSRSSRTRRGSSGPSATRTDTAFAWTSTRRASPVPALRWAS